MQCVGPIAQLVELPAHNRTVGGSSPSGPTIFLFLRIVMITTQPCSFWITAERCNCVWAINLSISETSFYEAPLDLPGSFPQILSPQP